MKENNSVEFRFTVKNIIRVLSVICVIIAFCPTFLVSCSGQEIKVSAMDAVSGLKSYGNTVGSSHPVLLITLLLPAAIFAVFFVKNLEEKKAVIVVIMCGVIDLIVWIMFRSAVKTAAEQNYCQYKSTGWFALCMLCLILIIAIGVLVYIDKIELEAEIGRYFTNNGLAGNTLSQSAPMAEKGVDRVSPHSDTTETNTGSNEKTCPKCGAAIVPDSLFCIKCGTPVPEDFPETNDKENVLFCPKCGKEQGEDAVFCISCGYKIKS